jgi:hypothetical protein
MSQAISLEPLKKIVEVFNRYEGFHGDGSPFSVARKQPQLDAALLYSTIVDLTGEDLTRVYKDLAPDDAFQAASKDDSEWKMVRPADAPRHSQPVQDELCVFCDSSICSRAACVLTPLALGHAVFLHAMIVLEQMERTFD